MQKQTVQLLWLFVEVGCIIRSSLATFNVTMNLSGGDTVFSVFTVSVIELSLFAMLLMAGIEQVAPLAAIILIAFSAVLQWAELGLLTGTLDAQTKDGLRYAVSFAPTVLLLVGLTKRLTGSSSGSGSLFGSVTNWFKGLVTPSPVLAKTLAVDVEPVGRVRKCSECGTVIPDGRKDRSTCSSKCRRARARRLG